MVYGIWYTSTKIRVDDAKTCERQMVNAVTENKTQNPERELEINDKIAKYGYA